jgi:signal transduction histidine kinase
VDIAVVPTIATVSASNELEMPQLDATAPTDRTVLAGIAIARWAVLGWLTVTTVLQREDLRRPVVAVLALAVAFAWVAGTTFLLRQRPALLTATPLVITEAVLAWVLLVLDGWAFETGHAFGGSQNLAGNWPLVAAVALATAMGPWWGAGIGAAIASGRYVGARVNGVTEFPGDRILSLLSSAVFYAIAAIVFGAMTRRLRAVENEVAMRRARDEVARTLHDGVLQTLALVDRRTRTSDPELAGVARASDRELRAWLFHGVRTEDEGGTLEERLRRVAERVAGRLDVPVTVSVLDDPDAPPQPESVLHALTGATGEAIANAAKHASPNRVVVFAEVDDDGSVFVSIRDDGSGFDPSSVRFGRGIEHSINARLQEIGGSADIISSPGAGTEVRLRAGTPGTRT